MKFSSGPIPYRQTDHFAGCIDNVRCGRPFSQPESSIAIVQEAEICPAFLGAVPGLTVCPAQAVPWGNITVPALVVDGALDLLVGEGSREHPI